jgi:multisubunit Na+/H+ antiporter MnhE subunit
MCTGAPSWSITSMRSAISTQPVTDTTPSARNQPLSSLSPTLFSAPTTQRSALGQAIYANSITLTPGTVTVDLGASEVTVHALTREAASGVQEGEMDRRVRELE